MQKSMNYDQAQRSSFPAAGAPGMSENHSHDELRAAHEAQGRKLHVAGSSESRRPLEVSDGIQTGGSSRQRGPVHPVIPRQGKATSLKLVRVEGAEQGIHGRGRERVTGLPGGGRLL